MRTRSASVRASVLCITLLRCISTLRSIITEHGGTLDFYNNDDTGATFFFNLPEVSTDE